MDEKDTGKIFDEALKNKAEATLDHLKRLFESGDIDGVGRMLKEHHDVVVASLRAE